MPQGTRRPSPYLASADPRPLRLRWPGILLILHMSLIIPPPFVCLEPKKNIDGRRHGIGLVISLAVGCGAGRLFWFWECMASAYILLLFFLLPARKRDLVLYFAFCFFYSPLVYNVR